MEATWIDLKKRGWEIYYKGTEVSQAIKGQSCYWDLKQCQNKDVRGKNSESHVSLICASVSCFDICYSCLFLLWSLALRGTMHGFWPRVLQLLCPWTWMCLFVVFRLPYMAIWYSEWVLNFLLPSVLSFCSTFIVCHSTFSQFVWHCFQALFQQA